MRFLIDADCPRSISRVLKKAGHDVTDIRDINPQATDQEIYKFIQNESRILITRDTDFANILRYPATRKCAIILLRAYLFSVDEIVALTADLITHIPEKDLMGSLTIARKGRYRIRKF